MIHRLITTWNKTNLMKRIAIGIVLGVILALIFPKATGIGLLGRVLCWRAPCDRTPSGLCACRKCLSPNTKRDRDQYEKVIVLYLLEPLQLPSSLFWSITSSLITITLTGKAAEGSSPNGIGRSDSNLLLKIVDNPVNALQQANYIGILSWATVFEFAMREGERT